MNEGEEENKKKKKGKKWKQNGNVSVQYFRWVIVGTSRAYKEHTAPT